VVGIGVVPNTGWLEGSGLVIDNGVVCDATTVAAPGITAAGDVARWTNTRFDETARVEHWDHAIEMAQFAARRLLLRDEDAVPFTPVPYFWSDQYDRKTQLAGRCRPDDDVQIVTGSTEERRFAAIYGRNGRVVAVLGMNRPRHVCSTAAHRRRASWDEPPRSRSSDAARRHRRGVRGCRQGGRRKR
jgi:3-phenylpropionate/trans-cinnamate dioxygenase ferredoxin reductase subunit